MKTKLLIGITASLLGLAITLPVQTATISITDSSCDAFTAITGASGNLTVTCNSTIDPAPPPPPPTAAPVCGAIVTDTVGDTGFIYQGDSVILTANCPGATSFAWSGIGTTATDTGATLHATPTAYTVYGVTGKNEFGSSAEALRLVAVLDPTQVPVCTPTASPASIESGQSTTLTAGCDSATGYTWASSSTGEQVAAIESPVVSPTQNTTYTLTATNALGVSQATVDVNISAGPSVADTNTYSCDRATMYYPSIQQYYDIAGPALSARMKRGEAYAMSFTTGSASRQIQTLDIVEWAGTAYKDVTIAKESCNYIYPEYSARDTGDRISILFTVGETVSKSTIRPDIVYPMLEPNTQYFVNLKNSDPRNGGKETCPSLGCGFNLKFFSTVP